MHKSTSVHIATPYCDNVTMWRCDNQGEIARAHRHPLIVTMWQCDETAKDATKDNCKDAHKENCKDAHKGNSNLSAASY